MKEPFLTRYLHAYCITFFGDISENFFLRSFTRADWMSHINIYCKRRMDQLIIFSFSYFKALFVTKLIRKETLKPIWGSKKVWNLETLGKGDGPWSLLLYWLLFYCFPKHMLDLNWITYFEEIYAFKIHISFK